jgi:hypothetical protein
MLAYNNDHALKERLIATMRAHREAETLVQGVYWEDGRGCAVGCLTHKQAYEAWKHYETEWGIPRILARLEDALFEALPTDEARAWPERFLAAIKPGADLSRVWDRFAVWLLVHREWGVLQFARAEESRAIQRVADLYERKLSGGDVSATDWESARHAAGAAGAAYAAAGAAAYAAHAAHAAGAADAAAAAAGAAYAAAGAADAAYAADDDDVYTKWRRAQADKLIELLEVA